MAWISSNLVAKLGHISQHTIRRSDSTEVNRRADQPEVNRRADQPEVNRRADQPEVNRRADQPEVNRRADQPEVNRRADQPEVNNLPPPAVQLQSQQSSAVVFHLPAAPVPATLAVKGETFEDTQMDTDLPCTPPLPDSLTQKTLGLSRLTKQRWVADKEK